MPGGGCGGMLPFGTFASAASFSLFFVAAFFLRRQKKQPTQSRMAARIAMPPPMPPPIAAPLPLPSSELAGLSITPMGSLRAARSSAATTFWSLLQSSSFWHAASMLLANMSLRSTQAPAWVVVPVVVSTLHATNF